MDDRSSDGTFSAVSAEPPAAAPPAPPPAHAPVAPHRSESSVRETIESILVAFILAFIFRAFIVEAFVIPTGSMAPTLLGAHVRFHCDDCGYRFDGNYSARQTADGSDLIIPPRAGPEMIRDEEGRPTGRVVNKVYRAFCPNCGFQVPREQATNPPVHYGDRILVLKYLYLVQDPQRWDVVVFKSPAEPRLYHYEQNYIKRLVGLPGEAVMILDGDIYTADAASADDLSAYQIQPKPRHVQEVLWRVIYDNDYHPRRLLRPGGDEWQQPWTPSGDAWNLALDGGRTFRFDGEGRSGSLTFNRGANTATHAFTDWLAYDLETPWKPSNVGDLKLELHYQRLSGNGPMRLNLARGDDVFIAQITPKDVTLLRKIGPAAPVQLGASVPLPDGDGQPLHVEFENVDYRVTLRVNGQQLLQTTPAQYQPDPPALQEAFLRREPGPRPSVRIEAEDQVALLRHIGLWRDIYYTNKQNPGGEAPTWASPADFPEHVVRLGEAEYFVLGDNSLVSGDGRYWKDSVVLPTEDLYVDSGRVPARFMLGKAFFVYWPAGYRPLEFAPALAPNFGDMRFIR